MTGSGHYGIGTIRLALAVAAGVNVHVCDDAEAPCSTDFPKARQRRLADGDDAGVQRFRINIVVEHEFQYLPSSIWEEPTQQIGAALATTAQRSSRKFGHAGLPDLASTSQPRRCETEPAKQRVQQRVHTGAP
ncbi:hypothetical protein BN961_03639 [Afipia felis]|uniref:Uncharacterized protein n=1 Tax=Afipia felis TaxID=1035 RepID=A0A090MUX4_AFIFE|nr:hypothetical protein BN961_03639 [Afipia felis]